MKNRTVEELIEELRKFPKNAVFLPYEGEGDNCILIYEDQELRTYLGSIST